jgi:TetR/AcrR family transcriptional regulator, transcriptional repressor for nem operon
VPAKKDNRVRLVRAAEKMTSRRGFRQTTIAEIAREAQVPLGNVYYYFKTKDEIGDAVLDRLLSEMRAMLESFEAAGSPKDRLCACVDAVVANKTGLSKSGCQVGSLCTELHKEGGALAEKATLLFEEQLRWMEAQFGSIAGGREAPRHALHLLSALQGVSLLAHSFRDPNLVVEEAAELKRWIRALSSRPGGYVPK